MDRLQREKDFHNRLAAEDFGRRRLIDRLSETYYSKDDDSPLWASVWQKTELTQKVVLDYGCGTGIFSQHLVRRGALVYGIDVSLQAVGVALRIPVNGVRPPALFVADAQQTPFPDSFFDYVFGNGIVHHLDLDSAYAEVARILKPGGTAFLMEPLAGNPFVNVIRRITPFARSSDEKPLSLPEIEKASTWFAHRSRQDHFLTALLGAPLHIVNRRLARAVVKALDWFDQVLFSVLPPLRRYAWLSLIELRK